MAAAKKTQKQAPKNKVSDCQEFEIFFLMCYRKFMEIFYFVSIFGFAMICFESIAFLMSIFVWRFLFEFGDWKRLSFPEKLALLALLVNFKFFLNELLMISFKASTL
jgi:hypothetical protein